MSVRGQDSAWLIPGNRAATFPLQTLGYDVDVVNTVQFSNHTGECTATILHSCQDTGIQTGTRPLPSN
jgi:pyridoxal/pyridoxine/pyridoxamine kinase